MNTCKCGRPTKDDAFVCDNDLDRFARALGEVTWIDEELETTITKQRASASGDGGRSAETPMMYDVAASQARDNLRHELALLVRFCAEEGVRASDPAEGLPDDNIIAMSRWLLWRVDGLAFNDMAEEFIASVTRAVAACQKAIDTPPERRFAGSCPECKRDLYHRPDATEVKCSGCGSRYDVAAVQDWMRERINEHLAGRLVTASEGAKLLGRLGAEVAQRTIDKWHERGRLDERGHDHRGHRLYRWEDLLGLVGRDGRKAS